MLNSSSRMFSVGGERVSTFNLIVGCNYNCIYCYARVWSRRFGRNCRYCLSFYPHFHVDRLRRKPVVRGCLPVFINDMCDMLGDWIPDRWIEETINYISRHADVDFMVLTKNPKRYHEFKFPDNAILGCTVETNLVKFNVEGALDEYPLISKAPSPVERIDEMISLEHDRKFISIEPVLDFNLDEFVEQIYMVNPSFIYIGYCNPVSYARNMRLPEPSLSKVHMLIDAIKGKFEVRVKTLRYGWYEKPLNGGGIWL